jgi:hypothetical protein
MAKLINEIGPFMLKRPAPFKSRIPYLNGATFLISKYLQTTRAYFSVYDLDNDGL